MHESQVATKEVADRDGRKVNDRGAVPIEVALVL